MAGGFLRGVLWGGAFGVVTAGVASVLAPPPVAPMVSDTAPAADLSAPDTDASRGEAGSNPDTAIVTTQLAPQQQAPEVPEAATIGAEMQTPPSPPVTGTPEVVLPDPDIRDSDTGLVVAAESPVLPNPLAMAPMELEVPESPALSTETVQPPAPPVEQPAEVVEEAENTPENQAAETETAAVAPEPEQEPLIRPLPVPAGVATPDTDTEMPQSDPGPEEEASSEMASSARPTIGEPVGALGDRDTGVTIRRPGSATAQVDDETVAAEAPTQDASATSESDPRAITRYAQAFEDPAGKPVMAIVLIDDGTSPVTGSAGIAALRSFPYPISFAVDARLPDAEERMTIYRNEGFEVLAMIDLPEGARASDVETAFGAILPVMSEVVGVLEGVEGGLQGSREVADQVTSILLQTGHGLLTQDKGLNTMPKLARKAGVPAEPIFRDFDGKGQSASVIRRFLDQAAFKAGQEGAVVMLGRLQPDTITALLLWGLQDRAGKVALTPVSAVLLREG